MILIVTHGRDVTADLVIRHLVNTALFSRLNTDELGSADCHFGFEQTTPTLFIAGRQLIPSQIGSVWARRFVRPKSLESTLGRFAAFVTRELSYVMEAFLDAVDGLQVNSYDVDRRAGNRLIQSQLAQKLGFLVPKTLVTQSVEKARCFLDEHERVVAKSISFGMLDQHQGRVAHTSLVTASADFEGLGNCPALFQQAIQKKHDWRVTTVGDRIFSARTRTGIEIDGLDWRRTKHASSIFETAELPTELAVMIRDLCAESQLHFGAHDLIESPKGDFYFLETNPAGQWGWLEIELGLQIGKALADLLCMGKT